MSQSALLRLPATSSLAGGIRMHSSQTLRAAGL